MKLITNLINFIITFGIWLLFLACLAYISSCSTTKEVVKTVTNTVTDSTAVHQRDSLHKVVASERLKHEEEIKTIKSTGIVFSDCDTVIIDSSCNVDSIMAVLKATRNKVKILADGSIEAEGRIRSAYSNNESLRQYNFELEQKVTELSQVKDSLAVELEKVTAVKVTTKDVKRGFPWLWFLVGLALGLAAGHVATRWLRPLK